jgi:putative ABC transport system permease protein
MIRNYILTALRSIMRQKGFSLINIMGLTIGLSVSFLILFYVFDELSYDKFHNEPENIYRLVIKGTLGDMNLQTAVTPRALAAEVVKDIPDVEISTVFDIASTSSLLNFGETKLYDRDFLFADTSFLRIFNFPLLYGDPQTCLSRPYTILVSESFAKKYFKGKDPSGQVIRMNEEHDYLITGVFREIPSQSHMSFNFLVSAESRIAEEGKKFMEDWESLNAYTYVKLRKDADLGDLQSKLDTIILKRILDNERGVNVDLKIIPQKISEIHLHSHLLGEIKENSEISYIWVLLAVVTGIIGIASINFMNLSTAKSATRAKEVGIRKILGSQRSMLIGQFISESVIISLISFIFSLALVELTLPVFNQITGKYLQISYFSDWKLLLFLGISLVTGFLAGSYPAFYLSSVPPVKILQNRLRTARTGNLKLRNLLVFIQFAISTGLIICTLIIYLQLQYLKNKELGFQKESVVSIELRNPELRRGAAVLKEEILKIPGVESASLSTTYPGRGLKGSSFSPEGTDEKNPWLIFNFTADEDFVVNTMRMKVVEGRGFSREFGSDTSAVIINETLRNRLGWKDPIGRKIYPTVPDSISSKPEYTVIGVVADFHFQPLQETVDPIMINLLGDPPEILLVRMDPLHQAETIRKIGLTWSELNPEHPFDYEFLNDFFEDFYYSEKRMGQILIYISLFAIFIASIGLLGLASFTAEQRTKEIGIRKVMGATSISIITRLSFEYLRMIVFAGILAWPLSYFIMHNWLQKFSYRTDMPLWVFLTATGITTVLSLLVVNIQTLKAASSNPVNSLRYE